ncbi:MAG: 4-alpha-glucanotransferase [Verrucomicrobia bacterium]|nr:4-alpha-glucanotransferase [Verrucomicrobiota bacterium]
MPLTDARQLPRATYRVQLTPSHTFADLEERLPYLRALGISDLYLSPVFSAAPGSEHGYDVSDYTRINPELGGRAAFDRLCAAAHHAHLGLILDFVPNHMGIGGSTNAWWRDVLESGPRSAYATFFDIQWRRNADGRSRVLVPVLEGQFGRMLEEGRLVLSYADGFNVDYYDIRLPLNPATYPQILASLVNSAARASPMAALIAEFQALLPGNVPPEETNAAKWPAEVARLKQRLADLLQADPELQAQLAALLDRLNRPPRAELAALLEDQHYRLARWKTGMHEINYRRFFAINSLIGLHMEDPKVFQATHALLGQLIDAGCVDGLRIDHIDGLREPAQYLSRLQTLAAKEKARPFYVVVEKILNGGEQLPQRWQVHGTTGYEFISQLAGVLVDPANEPRFTAACQRFTGETSSYPDEVAQKKALVMRELFADVLDELGGQLAALVAEDLKWRDFTQHELTTALTALTAGLAVYRTYVSHDRGASAHDAERVRAACEQAIAREPRIDPQPLEFLRDLITGHYPPAAASREYRRRVREWVLTWQQYTGAVMAKSVEDTAFYTYVRFVGLNEVGCDPGVFGQPVAAFHEANRARLAAQPHSLLATSTHDTKMSEDVRARLYALSELPGEWEERIFRWRALGSAHTSIVERHEAPDPVDQYRLFQILLGAWPLDPGDAGPEFRERLRTHFRKAVSEAKRHTSDLNPNERYLAACDRYIDGIASPETGKEFLQEFLPFAQRLARAGCVNSLTQVILKATCPGVPDFYQGSETWDFSLVDPDNRRPVNFTLREQRLASLAKRNAEDLLHSWRDGGIKMWVMHTLLNFRFRHHGLFFEGSYEPLQAEGAFAEHIVAFVRRHVESSIVVILPRLSVVLGSPPIGPVWDDTRIILPGPTLEWRDLFTGKYYFTVGATSLRSLFARLPFAVLAPNA